MCTREISKFEQLFRDNFAPSNKHNSILLIGCNDSPLSCMLNSRFLETIFDSSRCAFPVVRCFDGQKTKTADVMTINEVTLNLSGCKYLYSSVSGTESALTFERLSLDWWLEEGCTNTTCSENANCTQVTLPEGRLGHRCTCLDGYHGDAFNVNGSCRSADKLYRRCSTPFNCGDLSELSYPFWISGREDCGHPDFELDCSGGFAELNTSSVKYRILQVTNNPRIIRLARSDYMSNLCPQNPQNASFNKNVFLLDPDTEVLTIYYDCPLTPRFDSAYVGEFACEDDTRSYYVTRNLSSPLLAGISEILKNFEVTCRKKVSIPASGPALNTLLNNRTQDNLKKALQRGFKLGFNSDCPMCIDSGGACGYNQITRAFLCYCPDGRHNRYCGYRNKGRSSYKAKIGIGITSILVGLVVAGGLLCFIMRRQKSLDDRRQQNLEALIPLKRYSYAQVKKITNSFAKVVGKGGFGTVYRGTLCDGGSVAVKLLKDSKTNSEDFMNEVASMSKTSHVNIVNLLGFCSEGSKRAILYEFLENGSLDKFISRKTSMTVDWKTLYNIALGIARGLEYLHHGCKARIVHFDIKPQNVLLDDNLCPKVSDFGLAKLCEKKESLLSVLDTRGTIGFIAPEVFSRMYGRVSHKSDVYSYGMLVLEMIGARNKERSDQNSSSNTSSMYFPEWIYKDLEKGRRIIENGISIEEEEIAKKITLVGLWCIQSSPSDRPPMNKVVEMLEGNLEALEVPPRPVLQIPSLPLQESSSLLMDISVCTEA